MGAFLKSVLSIIFGAFIEAILNKTKKPPEQVQKEKDDEKTNNYVGRINNGDPGFILPAEASKDKWDTTPKA